MPVSGVMDPSAMYDVAIAGAGLAGASLALQLAMAGTRVVLLDAARFPRDKLCGEFLSPESWGALERLRLADAVARSGFQEIRRIRLTTPSGSMLDAQIAGPDDRPGIGLSRWELDALIVERALDAGANVIDGARVGGPLLSDDHVVGLSARSDTNGPFDVKATVVVAANGRHSGLVHRTGLTWRGSWFRPGLFGMKRHLIVADAAAIAPPDSICLHLVPGGYGGSCPIEGALTNFCALVPEAGLRRHRGNLDHITAELCARNRALGHLFGQSTPVSDWKTVSGVAVEFSRPRLPGIFYAGDCQGTVDPLGGQGMTMALLGAELLVPFIKHALLEGGVEPPLQRAYEAAWHARFKRTIRLCRVFHHALVHPAAIDIASAFRPLAVRLLAGCYRTTRQSNERWAMSNEA